MSFVYTPHENMVLEVDLKKRSDDIIHMFEMMNVNGPGTTLDKMSDDIYDLDDDMDIITNPFDPKGVQDQFYFNRRSKISELTQLKPD